MKYLQALEMQQEMKVALEYKDMFPGRDIEVAKKYSIKQWEDCMKTLLSKLDEDKQFILDFLKLVIMARKMT